MKTIDYKLKFIEKCEMCGCKDFTFMGRRLNGQQRNLKDESAGISLNILKCDGCDLIFSNPLPVPLNIQDHYSVDPKSYWSEEYFHVDENYFKFEIDRAKSLLPEKNEKLKALDIGAGIGKSIKALSNAGFDAYGIEPSESFYKLAIEKNKIDPSRVFNITIEELNKEVIDTEFDFVTFGAVLEHLAHPKQALEKAASMLKSGGILHVEVPYSKWFIADLINLSYKIKGKQFVTNLSPMHSPFHLYEFSINSFEEAAKDINMKVVHTDHFVCETYLPKFLAKIARSYMKKSKRGMQLSVWLKKD